MNPTLGRIVWYRSKTGSYTCPAMVTAVQDSLYRPNVEAGHMLDLSSSTHVHLTVFTAGLMGHVSKGTAEEHPELVAGDRLTDGPAGGTYQEFDIPQWEPAAKDALNWFDGDYSTQEPGTWAWPPSVAPR